MAESRNRRVGAYAKLLTNYQDDDSIIQAGLDAELLFVRGMAFCASSNSDGFITDAQLTRRVGAGMRDAQKRAERLVEVGVWERHDGGYLVRSWLKIHPSTEEKGYTLRKDRERKRRRKPSDSEATPDGIQAESERNPNGVTPESLICTYVSSEGPTDQVTAQQISAPVPLRGAQAPTAQTLVAEWIDHCPKQPPRTVVGQVAKHIGQLLDEGITYPDVRAGVAAWQSKGLNPSAIPSVVHEVMNSGRRNGTVTQLPTGGSASAKAATWIAYGQGDPA